MEALDERVSASVQCAFQMAQARAPGAQSWRLGMACG